MLLLAPIQLVVMSKHVNVNMVTWNAALYLPACLESLKSQSYKDWSLFVIDNGSTDGTLGLIKKALPQTEILCHKKNTGFAPAHNEALRRTKGDYILLLNQDIVLHKDFLKNAAAFLEKNKKAGALQPKLIRYDFKNLKSLGIIDTTGLLMYKSRRIVNRGQGQIDKNQLKGGEVFGADGAAPVYRRAALDDVALKIGDKLEYLDEDFFSYKEDVDLAWRLRLAGWQAFYEPTVKGFHGRGSGDAASTNPLEIVKERRKISGFAKTLSWRNQRLMQIKNELWPLLFIHLPWFLVKELAAWAYIFVFEPQTVVSLPKFFKQIPKAFEKRHLIMAKRRANFESMSPWFI